MSLFTLFELHHDCSFIIRCLLSIQINENTKYLLTEFDDSIL